MSLRLKSKQVRRIVDGVRLTECDDSGYVLDMAYHSFREALAGFTPVID